MARAQNTAQVELTPTATGVDADQWSLWDASSGGNLLVRRSLANDPAAITSGQTYIILANNLELRDNIGTSGTTEAMAIRGLRGKVRGGVYVQLEDSADNSAVTNRVVIPEAQWDIR